MILRRRGDLELVMAQLGTLFATEGEVDKYFQSQEDVLAAFRRANKIVLEKIAVGIDAHVRDLRVTARIVEHIQFAPEREAARLQEWARGYDDGIRTALALLKREDGDE